MAARPTVNDLLNGYNGTIFAYGQTGAGKESVRRFVSGGSDNLVKIWDFSPATASYELLTTLQGHTDWVRDVAWSPTVLTKSYIASASQDKTVRIWTTSSTGGEAAAQGQGQGQVWSSKVLNTFEAPVWRVSGSDSCRVCRSTGARAGLVYRRRESPGPRMRCKLKGSECTSGI